jgi:glycosyltransferase involved in cell wall biosynthesis
MPETSLFNSLSVIIPTYNRERILAKALEGYLAQSSPQLIHELLVVDDGSTDETERMVGRFIRRSQFTIRYVRQANKGPAAARNFGIREAKSKVVLFTDSDIVPSRNLVAQHMDWHNRNPKVSTAVLGYVTWPSDVNVTPFMRWYGEEGALFGYRRLRGKREVDDFHFFYTCNLSLKVDFLRSCGRFDEEFKSAAYEDSELGYRLGKCGLQLLYNSAALGYHYQFFSFEDACRKLRANADARQLFLSKVGGQQPEPVSRAGRFQLARTIAKKIVIGAMRRLSPSRKILDSRFPFPGFVYELLLRHDATLG